MHKHPMRTALLALSLGLLSPFVRAQSAPAPLSFSLDGKPVTGTVVSAISYGGNLDVEFKTSLGTKLTLEIYRNTFSPLPFVVGFDEGKSNEVREKVGKFFYFDNAAGSAAPYFAPGKGTITITAFNAATKTVSGTFAFTLKRTGFDLPQAERGKTVALTAGRFTNVKFKQM
jgi:hypothetical protein